jgi:oxygen-dependent protoporphyrinogen oxidase
MINSVQVAVVGGGISGLTTAWLLARSGVQVAIAEASGYWGGAMVTGKATTAEGDWLWEEGPNSFSPNQELLDLIEEVGLGDRVVWADRKLPRFVYWQGKLQPVPTAPPAVLSSQLLSGWGKLRALIGALGFVVPARAGDESVADFFRRHLGQEVLDRLVAPFVSGVYAGDPQQLGMRSAFRRVWQLEQVGGGLVAGLLLSRSSSKANAQLGQLGSLVGGLATLPQTLVQKLQQQGVPTHLQWRLQRIVPQSEDYQLGFQTPAGETTLLAKVVVLAMPAYACADLLADVLPRSSSALRSIEYPPVACIALGYGQEHLRQPLVGFGHLIPRSQGIETLGTIWASSLFPDRAPKGYVLFLNFIGGATNYGVAHLSQAEIVAQVHQDLQKILLKPNSPAPIVLNTKLWPRAIPQYGLDHNRQLEMVQRDMAKLPNVYLCANYVHGVAVGDCVRGAKHLAQKIWAQHVHAP